MTKSPDSTHMHPNSTRDRLIQYGAAGLMIVMLLAVLLQIVLALTGAPGGLFLLAAVATLLLILPVLLLTSATPSVTISAEGLTIEPVIWKARFVPWQDVLAIKDYPLLPPANTEVTRRALVGRKKYRPAEGKMLLIRGLPPQYRVASFFAGEHLTPIIALTNRTHTDYDRLMKQVSIYVAGNRENVPTK